VFSFVPDDAFGEAHLLGKRRFEVVLRDGHEINSVLSGMPLLLALRTEKTGMPALYAELIARPGFGSFAGASAVFVERDLDPVYLGDPADPLRYRGRVHVRLQDVSALEITPPIDTAGQGASGFVMDWPFAALERALRPDSAPVSLTLISGQIRLTKQARLQVRVRGLRVGTEDPYVVWAEPACEPAVHACIQESAGASDLSACGAYRPVQRCLGFDPCAAGQGPALYPLALPELADAERLFNAGCASGGAWCHLDSIRAYSVSSCAGAFPPIAEIWKALAAQDQHLQDPPLDSTPGRTLDRPALAQHPFFTSAYSTNGPTVFRLLDTLWNNPVREGWVSTSAIPCCNCHEFRARVVVFPATGNWIYLLDGTYGYDS